MTEPKNLAQPVGEAEIQKDYFSENLEKNLKQTVEGETEEERLRYSKEVKGLILEERRKLLELAMVDPLTNAFNRGYFENAIAKLVAREKRNLSDHKAIEPFSVLMIDLDHFKSVNDDFGHLVGDEVLKKVVDIMKTTLKRGTDMVARYGGEEFIVILENTDENAALIVSEKIRLAIEKETEKLKSDTFPKVTASIGCATYNAYDESSNSAKELVHSADMAAFISKGQGRNKVTAYSDKIKGQKKEPSVTASMERILPADKREQIAILREMLERLEEEVEKEEGAKISAGDLSH